MRRFIMYFLVLSTAIDVTLSFLIFRTNFRSDLENVELNPLLSFLIDRAGWEMTFFFILPSYFLVCFLLIGLGLSDRFKWVYERLKVWYWTMILAKTLTMTLWTIFMFRYFHC